MASPSAGKSTKGKTDTSALSAEFQAEITQLRDDVSAIAKTLASFGKARAGSVQDQVSHLPDDIAQNARQALVDMRQEIDNMEKKLETRVREKPVQSLLMAVGAGFLLSLLMKR